MFNTEYDAVYSRPRWNLRSPELPERASPPLNKLHHDAQPLRVGQPYDVLMEHAVRRGDAVGYGAPEFALGDPDGLVSEGSISPPPSSPTFDAATLQLGGAPADQCDANGSWPSQELLAQAVEAARAHRHLHEASSCAAQPSEVGSAAEDDADSSSGEDATVQTGSKRKRRRGTKAGRNQPMKNPAHNAGQGARPGKNNASHQGKKRRKAEAKKRKRERNANRPYEREHPPGYYRRHHPVVLVSLSKMDVVYETTAYGYTHKNHRYKIKGRCWTDADLARAAYADFEWDGSETVAIIDASDIVVGLLLAGPRDRDRVYWERYEACGPRLTEAVEEQLAAHPQAWTKGLGAQRGDFCSLSVGINYNFTQKRPANLVLDEHQRAVADALLHNEDLKRVAGHAAEGVAHYFPLPFDHARERMRELHELLPHLEFPFDNSIYPTLTFNGGPQTACYEHADVGNLPGFPCWVYAMGAYNPQKSARFIMHDFRLVVTFPPHRIIALSSAGVRHSNTALQPGETRYSIAGYMTGSLMRYAAYRGNVGELSREERQRVDVEREDSWEHQHARLSNFWDLEEDREELYRRERERARKRAPREAAL